MCGALNCGMPSITSIAIVMLLLKEEATTTFAVSRFDRRLGQMLTTDVKDAFSKHILSFFIHFHFLFVVYNNNNNKSN